MNNTTPPTALKTLFSDVAANGKVAVAELKQVKDAHLNLAKAEVSQNITKPAVAGLILLVAAAILALDMLMLLFLTAAFGIYAAGMSLWASFGIVSLVLLVIVAVLAGLGAAKLKKIKSPERSINAGKQLAARVKDAVK